MDDPVNPGAAGAGGAPEAARTRRRAAPDATEANAIRRIKYRHLRCLIELAESGKVTAAANTLHVTQPAVSKTIRELEEILGARLFERDGATFQLTAQGRVFLRYAEASLSALGDGVQVTLGAARVQADVTVGALTSVAASLLPDAVLEFDGADTVLIRVISGPNTHLLDELRAGKIDFVVGAMPEPARMGGFHFEQLYRDRINFLVRPGHPLDNKDVVELRSVADYAVLIPSALSNIRVALDRAFISRGVANLPRLIEAASPEFARGYVRKSDAIWAATAGASEDDVLTGRLIALNLDAVYLPVSVGVTTRGPARLSVPASRLVHCLRRVAERRTGDEHE